MSKTRLDYDCTACGTNAWPAFVGREGRDWGGVVSPGERLCGTCFKRRGGEASSLSRQQLARSATRQAEG